MVSAIRRALSDDAEAIASIHRETFSRQKDSETWVRATLAAHPRIFVYILEQAGIIAGYIFWVQKSGIRPSAVVELDQIVISANLRGQGLGEILIKESLAQLKAELARNEQLIKSILVSTRADNQAQRLYEKVLGAKVVSVINNLYSASEVFMVADITDS